jgi:putative ABC transport system ATP-binding protein
MSKGIVETRKLVKLYAFGKVRSDVLRGVDLQVTSGEIVSIMGPSGCGKTTLLNLISGLDKATNGEIIVDGHYVTSMSDSELTRFRLIKMGIIFQSYNLIPTLTSLENVELPMSIAGASHYERRERAESLLEEVGLSQKFNHMPHELSGGEQQRVAIARALANSPAIVLADEPTGNLDSKTSKEVVSLMRRLNEEERQTFIIVTHDQQVAEAADRIVQMKDGVIIREAPKPKSSHSIKPLDAAIPERRSVDRGYHSDLERWLSMRNRLIHERLRELETKIISRTATFSSA